MKYYKYLTYYLLFSYIDSFLCNHYAVDKLRNSYPYFYYALLYHYLHFQFIFNL